MICKKIIAYFLQKNGKKEPYQKRKALKYGFYISVIFET